ncbi:MAG: lamin tail domain-containing protein [Bacteroidales bacterium]|nr:lamin tail domain-containing protein [Bacteroidales bacterium]
MATAINRWGVFIGYVFCGKLLWGQTIYYNFENDSDLLLWLSVNKSRWELTHSGSISGNSSLHHNFDNASAGTDYIFCPYTFPLNYNDTIEWEFVLQHDYLPSSANKWIFYLASSTPAHCNPCNEATLGVGVNQTSSDDGLNIYYIDAKGVKCLTRSLFNWEKEVGTNPCKVKISRLPDGKLQLWTAVPYTSSLKLREEIQTQIRPAGCYFGISYTYSSSQDKKLWLDDIAITSKPTTKFQLKVDTVFFLTPKKLIIHFNSPLENTLKQNPEIVFLPSIDIRSIEFGCQQIMIDLVKDFDPKSILHLSLKKIAGKGGTSLQDTILNISSNIASYFDIIFSEIMFDPTPTRRLPELEYFELYNRCDRSLYLSGWTVSNGIKNIPLPDFWLQPNEFVLFTNISGIGKYDTLKNVMYCLPSSFLNNEKGSLWLKNESGEIISYIQYQSDYITDKYKKEGGWSIEIIDTENPCGGIENWQVSKSIYGGTPGGPNSVQSINRDLVKPQIAQLALPSDSTFIVFFSEPLHPLSLNTTNFHFSDESIAKKTAFFNNDGRAIEVILNTKWQGTEKYTIQLFSHIEDCVGNRLNDTLLEFLPPQLPKPGEIVINEILYETDDSLSEFIELFNTSEKYLDAGELILERIDTLTGQIEAVTQLLPLGFIIRPGAYLAITHNVEKVKSSYNITSPSAIFNWVNLFSLPDEGATLQIRTSDGQIIDRICYSPRMHFPLLSSTRGVSLERVNPLQNGTDWTNWHSAASNVGYATPGYKNSQLLKENMIGNNWLILSPSTFTPNNDGVDDVLAIQIRPSEPSTLITISVFSAQGHWLKNIAYQRYIGNEATFVWDGTVNGRLLAPGIYIIYARHMSSKRIISETKKTCTIVY